QSGVTVARGLPRRPPSRAGSRGYDHAPWLDPSRQGPAPFQHRASAHIQHMSDPKVRREIALRAAQLMYARHESEYFQAKRKASRMVGGSDRARDLPSNAEIREHIMLLAQLK